MPSGNYLQAGPPCPVERAAKRLGANLRTARLRRSLTLGQVAERIGPGRRAVMDAEKGKPTTGLAVYLALLGAFDLLDGLYAVADPAGDVERQALARSREGPRAVDHDL